MFVIMKNALNAKTSHKRRNAGLFVPDYEEEQTASNPRKESLELCDLEDSGQFDMNSKDSKDEK